jgi:hypothetical protein
MCREFVRDVPYIFDTYCSFPLFDVSILKIRSPSKVRGSLYEEDNLQCSYMEQYVTGIKLQAVRIALIW